MNTALMIGNALMGGVNTYMGLKAPSAGNTGYTPRPMPTGSSSKATYVSWK
jgi:hypothetical protein